MHEAPPSAAPPEGTSAPADRRLARRFASWFHRPRRLLMALGIAVLFLAAASPFVWAGYHWYAGRDALSRYHSGEARRHLNSCLRVWPWSHSAGTLLLAARAARRDGDAEEAVRLLQEAQEREGTPSPESLLEWSLLHASGGDLQKAEAPLKDLAWRRPDQVSLILEALIEGYMRMARMGEAIDCANQWITLEPENAQARYLRGNIYRQLGSSPKAATDYRRAVEIDPDLPGVRWRLAVALVDIGRYEEALQHLEFLRRGQAEDVQLLVRLAMCLHRLGQTREARTLLETILARHPDNGLALLTRGQMAQLAGQLPEAEKWLREAVRVMPNDYKAHWSLCDCLRQQGKTDEAEVEQKRTDALRDRWERLSELTSRLLSQKPDDPALQCELGKILLQLGLPEAGKTWLLSAVQTDGNCIPALTALADYYAKEGDPETAKSYRQRARRVKGGGWRVEGEEP